MRPDLSELWLPLFLVPILAGVIILTIVLIDPKPRNEVCKEIISHNGELYLVEENMPCPLLK